MSRIFANRQYLLATAEQLEKGIQFTPQQMEFWATILKRIAEGESAEVVLNLKRRAGEKKADEDKRKRISFVLHLVASYYNPVIDHRLLQGKQPQKLTLEESIFKVLPLVATIMGDEHKYEYEQIRDWWYDKDKKHMQSPLRNRFDADNPFA